MDDFVGLARPKIGADFQHFLSKDLLRLRTWVHDRVPIAHFQGFFVALVLLTNWQHLYRLTCAILVLLPFLLAVSRKDLHSLTRSNTLRFCFAYLAMLWLSLLWTPAMPAWHILHIGKHVLANLAFVALTAWLVAEDDRHAVRLCSWMAGAAAITAAISLVVFYRDHGLGDRLAAWLWPNPNWGGAAFGLAAVGAVAGPASAPGRAGWRYFYLAVAAVLVVCVALAGSRAALLAIAAALLPCAALSRRWRPLIGLLLGAIIFACILVMGGWREPVLWVMRADSGRFELWSHFGSLILAHPWLGYGIRHDLSITIFNGLTTDDPHDMVLETWFRAGVLAAVAWLGTMAAALIAGFRHWRAGRGVLPLALALYVLVHGAFESALPMDGADWFWIYLWIPIGIAAGVEIRERRLQALIGSMSQT